MKKIGKYGCIIIIIIMLFACIMGFLLAYIPGRMTEKHTNKIVELYFDDMNYKQNIFESKWNPIMERVELSAVDGHKIPIFYYKLDNSYDNKTIILIHWHESKHKAMYPIADFFLDYNFNVVLYDAPAHGANTARRVSFGYYEKDDLESVVTYIESKMSKDNIIGALGQSMGGSTVAYYSGTDHAKQHLDFAIIDSAFTSMDAAIAWQMNEISPMLPTKLLIKMGSISNKLMYGYSFEDVSALNSVKMDKIPTLILHSKADQKCPFYMGEELFEAIPHDKKEFVIFDNSLHLKAFWDENEKYKSAVIEFIDKYTTNK